MRPNNEIRRASRFDLNGKRSGQPTRAARRESDLLRVYIRACAPISRAPLGWPWSHDFPHPPEWVVSPDDPLLIALAATLAGQMGCASAEGEGHDPAHSRRALPPS